MSNVFATFVRRGLPSAGRIFVQRQSRPYWQEREWWQLKSQFHGHYRTHYGSWKGRAELSPSGRFEMLIRHPPVVLEQHPHWSCFHELNDGWYAIHTLEKRDLSGAILAIETILREAYEI